jgi:hypothetical protein
MSVEYTCYVLPSAGHLGYTPSDSILASVIDVLTKLGWATESDSYVWS